MEEYPISFCSQINDGFGCSAVNNNGCSECLYDVMQEIINFFGISSNKKFFDLGIFKNEQN